jgi:hypothetical protein
MVIILNKEIKVFRDNRSRYRVDTLTLHKGFITTGARAGGGTTTTIRDNIS